MPVIKDEAFYLQHTVKPDCAEDDKQLLKLNVTEDTWQFIERHFGNRLVNMARLCWLCSYPYDALPEATRVEIYSEAYRLDCAAFIPIDNQRLHEAR